MEVRIGLVLIVEGPEEVHLDLSRIIVTGVNPVEVNPEEEALKVCLLYTSPSPRDRG